MWLQNGIPFEGKLIYADNTTLSVLQKDVTRDKSPERSNETDQLIKRVRQNG